VLGHGGIRFAISISFPRMETTVLHHMARTPIVWCLRSIISNRSRCAMWNRRRDRAIFPVHVSFGSKADAQRPADFYEFELRESRVPLRSPSR
jgi:hypothetical protein